MASAITTSNNNDSEFCVLCTSKHNRNRPSFCQCKHCSIPLCLDCMKEHHEELLQDVAEISHQYNELQELLQTKQTMIVDETIKSIEDVNQYFETYINELPEIQRKIIFDIERAKQDARDHVLKIEANLRMLGSEIQGLTKESIVQMAKMKNLSIEMKKIEQQIKTFQAMRTDNFIQTKPDFSIKFDSSSVEIETPRSTDMVVNEICQTAPQEPSFKTNTLNIFGQSFTMKECPINQPRKKDDKIGAGEDSSMSDDDDDEDIDTEDSNIDTSYDVDRMASDGENIMYTSYRNKGHDRIAYCLMDTDDDDEDECRDWPHSRIKDMIWWNSIGKFICATEDGVYTVDYTNKRFKITCVIRKKWSFIRVAANVTHLFIWVKSIENNFCGIEVYSTQFDYTRTIDFDRHRNESFVNDSVSFCVTENLIASIYTHKQNNQDILQVTFSDMNINNLNTVVLGECNRNVEIRTNGKDRFFITTGQRQFHVIVFQGAKQTSNLQYNGKWIAVVDNRRIAVSNGRSDIELVTY